MRQHRGGTVEERQFAALVAEEAQGRIHPVDAGNEARRHVMPEINIGLAEWQQIQQQL
ncbi:hypothetical protein D3C87_1972330 [compost metagenome]